MRNFLWMGGLLAVVGGCVQRSGSSLESDSDVQAFSSEQKIGRKIEVFPVTGRPNEICVLPRHPEGFDYSPKDSKNEEKLCAMDFHSPAAVGNKTPVAICPKTNSTNPGLDIHELATGASKSDFENKNCGLADRGAKKVAKFKTSITCSYTGSILGYYHLSAALGGAGDVPIAVVRSMDIEKHKPYTSRALKLTQGEFINSLWGQVQREENNPSRLGGRMFTSDLKQIYGALTKNPTDEARYSEINSGRMDTFMASAQAKRVFSSQGVGALAPRTLAGAAAILVQMKDISDMLLLDYIFKQQDRFGNIHKVDFFYFTDPSGKVDKVKVEDVNEKKEPMPAGAVPVQKMLLKDNDCGNRPGHEKNITDAHLSSIRHMSPKTYKRLQWLAQNWDAKFKDFFGKEALLAEPDLFGSRGLELVTKNVKMAAKILKDNCTTGKLLLDLDLEDHLASTNTGSTIRALCDQVFDPAANTEPTPTNPTDPQPKPVEPEPTTTCTEPPKAILGTEGSKWSLSHGGANADRFKAEVTLISPASPLKPEFTHKMFVKHDASDQSNLGFSTNEEGSKITGVRYNMKFAPGETRNLDLIWACNQFTGTMGTENAILKPAAP